MDMKLEQRLGAINGINQFKCEIKDAIESKTGWGKNELAELVDNIALDMIDRYSNILANMGG
jgi:hypothetical protein